jgi:hypothetical protein
VTDREFSADDSHGKFVVRRLYVCYNALVLGVCDLVPVVSIRGD